MTVINATHWHVLGAGAMGCLWAARLARAGHNVTLLLRDEVALRRLQGNGSRILLMDGDDQQRIKVHGAVFDGNGVDGSGSGSGADSNAGLISHLLVATKAHQTTDAIEAIRSRLTANATVVLLQNGMGIQQQITDALPARDVWIGVSTEGAFCPEYFTVVHAGHGSTRIGSLQNPSPDHAALLSSLRCALAVEFEADIETALWQKLLVNCAINPLTAIYRCRNGELLTVPERRQHLHAICNELGTLLHALQRDDLHQGLIERAEAVAQTTAKNRSSMLSDVDEKRRTEIEFITGYVCQQAEKHGIALPQNCALLQKIRALHPA